MGGFSHTNGFVLVSPCGIHQEGRTASGGTGVQIAEYVRGRQRMVEHVGSAHTEAELGVLLARARELLEHPAQGVLDLGVEPTPPVLSLVVPADDPGLFDLAATAEPSGRAGPARGSPERLERFRAVPGLRRGNPSGHRSTNAIESVNARYRRAVRARGHFPTEQAALKCPYLATRALDPTGKGRARWATRWKPALKAFAITFEGRIN